LKRLALCISLISVAALIIAERTPASAAVTTAALTATTPSYSGACPTTMAFTGSISGTPGTTFQYSLNRFINGVQQVQNVGAATLPASGTIAVADSFSIASTSAGVNFDQIWVHNIAGGQPDVYSNRAPFSVTCGSGGKPGGIYETTTTERGHSYALVQPPAPTNVHTTTDPKECAAHLPPTPIGVLLAPVCAEILTGGGAEIVFSWEGNSIWPDVDGFHVFNVAGHISNPGMASSAGGSNTVVFKKGPIGPACYVIRAYKGAIESADSIMACVAGGTAVKTVFLNPTQMMTHQRVRQGHTGTFGDSSDTEQDFHGQVIAGYTYDHGPGDARGDRYANFVYRSGVLYDVRSLDASYIYKAVLHLHVTKTDSSTSGGSQFPKYPSCLTQIGAASNAWWNGGDIQSAFDDGLVPNPGVVDVAVDVTTLVRRWFLEGGNQGFALRGPDENLKAFMKEGCESHYAPTQLEINFAESGPVHR
jgi:hypothetical protein